jgi:hypothetical protein
MQASGSYSNQDFGSMDAAVTVVLAALSAKDARLELGRLAEKLAALRASGLSHGRSGAGDDGLAGQIGCSTPSVGSWLIKRRAHARDERARSGRGPTRRDCVEGLG